MNGSQFAILWVNERGETEQFASALFRPKLVTWFPTTVLEDARQTALQSQSLQQNGANDDLLSDPQLSGETLEGLNGNASNWKDATGAVQSQNNGPYADSFDAQRGYGLNDRPSQDRLTHGTDLRRTSSVPPARPTHSMSMPEVPTYKSLGLRNEQLPIVQSKSTSPTGVSSSANANVKELCVGNTAEVTAFLEVRFRLLQQLVCKIVAKAWIKVLEPKKQTRFPYNKGDEARPPWWPANVRHKEPDHLMKPERINLLMFMLRNGQVPVSRLELATSENAALIPTDKNGLLWEIYRVAREEERVKNGEVGPTHSIYVTTTTRSSRSNPTEPESTELTVNTNMNGDINGDVNAHGAFLHQRSASMADGPRYMATDASPFMEHPPTSYPVMPAPPISQQQHHQQQSVHGQQNGYFGEYSTSQFPAPARSPAQEYPQYVPVRHDNDQGHEYTWPQHDANRPGWHEPLPTPTNGPYYSPLEHTMHHGQDDKSRDLSNVRDSYLQGPVHHVVHGHAHLSNFQAYINSERHAGSSMQQGTGSATPTDH